MDIFNIDWMELLDVFFRAIVSLVTLFFVTKLLGKKQVSQLSLFDYVIGISIGNFAAEMTINTDSPYLNGTVAVIFFGVIAYFISKLTMKSIKLRRFFTGVPTVIIEKGEIIEDNLRKVNFDLNDFLQECRSSGYFNIDDIYYAIMEANGRISFLPKAGSSPVTNENMNLKIKQDGLCANVIIDSHIMERNLKNINKDTKWLEKKLKEKNVKLDNVFLATVDVNEKLFIYEKNKTSIGDVLE